MSNYIEGIVKKYRLDDNLSDEEKKAKSKIGDIILAWSLETGNTTKDIHVSGSRAKGTAIKGSADFDLFVSIDSEDRLGTLYDDLYKKLASNFTTIRKQNVSIGITYLGLSIDVVPARKHSGNTNDHSLYISKKRTWMKTNVKNHINVVKASGRIDEIIALKAWKKCHGIDFPSIYLELFVLEGLKNKSKSKDDLDSNVWYMLEYIRDNIVSALVYDPSNTNNIISDDLTATEKKKIADKAKESRSKQYWSEIIW